MIAKGTASLVLLVLVIGLGATPSVLEVPQTKDVPKEDVLVRNGTRIVRRPKPVKLNDYIDILLANLAHFMIYQGLDPAPMPDVEEIFEWRALLIKYRGRMALTRGTLQGMSLLHRPEDVTVSYENNKLRVHAPMRFANLHVSYAYTAKFMGLGPRGGVDAVIKNLKFTVDLETDLLTYQSKLRKFKINKLGTMHVSFRGHILTDWVVNIFTGVITTILKGIISIVIQANIRDGLVSGFEAINLAICTFLGDCVEEGVKMEPNYNRYSYIEVPLNLSDKLAFY